MKYEIFQSNGKYYFNLKARNGQVILRSQGYASKDGCRNGIESVRKNGKDRENFDVKQGKDGRYMFNLLSTNKQIIGTSQMYKSKSSCDNGIQAVQRAAPDARVEEIEKTT